MSLSRLSSFSRFSCSFNSLERVDVLLTVTRKWRHHRNLLENILRGNGTKIEKLPAPTSLASTFLKLGCVLMSNISISCTSLQSIVFKSFFKGENSIPYNTQLMKELILLFACSGFSGSDRSSSSHSLSHSLPYNPLQ